MLVNAGPVEKALAEVRDTKKDLFSSAASSLLGELPTPAELAAAQPSRRFRPHRPEDCVVEFDEATKARLARDYGACTFIWMDRQNIPMFPMGITGAYLFDLSTRTELVVVMVEEDSPAAGFLKPYDVIIGANGRLFNDPVDSRPTLGAALAESQSPELKGKLTLQIVHEGVPANVVIDLGDSEPFSPTWPFNCPKSDRIAEEALECVKEHANVGGQPGMWEKLFLMASDDQGAMEMARRQIYQTAKTEGKLTYGNNWTWFVAFDLINHCEYYLRTGDASVLSAIQQGVDELNRRQFASGGWGNRYPPGYGEVNNVGYTSMIGLILARECGAIVDTDKLALAIRYFGKFCGVGTPYGDNIPPMRSGGGYNGINGLNAMAFNLLGEKGLAQRTARTICYSWPIREKGHSESTFSFAWGPVGALLAPPEEYHMFMNNMLWYYELMRTRDHGFEFSGSTRFGYPRGTTSAQGLFLFQRDPKLRILGAPKGPFSHPVPDALAPAVALFQKGNFAAALAAADNLLKDTNKTVRTRAEMLRKIIDFQQQNVAFTLESIQNNINAGDRETAHLQIDGLERLLGGPTPQTAVLRAAQAEPGAKPPEKTVLKALVPIKNEEAKHIRRPNPPAMLWETILPFAGQGVRKQNLLRSEAEAENEELTRTFELKNLRGEWLRVLLKHTEGGKIYLNGQLIAVIQASWSHPPAEVAPTAEVANANAYVLWPISIKALRQGTNTIVYKPLPRTRCTMDISLQIGPYIPENNNLMKHLAHCWTFDEETPGTHACSWGEPNPILALGQVESCKGAQGSALLLRPKPPHANSSDAGLLVIPDPKEPVDANGNLASMTLSLWVKNAGKDAGYLFLEHAVISLKIIQRSLGGIH